MLLSRKFYKEKQYISPSADGNTMKAIHSNWTELFQDCMMIIFVCGTIGSAKIHNIFQSMGLFPIFPKHAGFSIPHLRSYVLYLEII